MVRKVWQIPLTKAQKRALSKEIRGAQPPTVNARSRRRARRQASGVTSAMGGLTISTPVAAPAQAGVVTGSSRPIMRSLKESTTITHTEVVSNLTVVTTTTPSTVACYPSLTSTWLSGVAANWSKFRWLKLRFLYVPSCPTSTSGSVHMGFLYDYADIVPTTVTAMSSLFRYSSGPVWSGTQVSSALKSARAPVAPGAIVSELDVSRLDKPWYSYITPANLTTLVTTNASLGSMYVPARLVVLTADGSSTTSTSIGRIYMQYEIEVIEPVPSALQS